MKKTCKYLNYFKQLHFLTSTVTGCVSISAFASLVCVPAGIMSSAVGLNIYEISAGIKKYKSIKRVKKEAW